MDSRKQKEIPAMYYLYIKTHQKTGLKYLGYTSKDPFKYLGSGKYWKRHLKQHGNGIITEILLETESIENIKLKGFFYSELWNIVESEEWANLKPEEGSGGSWPGFCGEKNPMFGKQRTEKVKSAVSKANKGKKNKKLSILNTKRKWWTNGSIDTFQIECPPNFKPGRSLIKGKSNPVNIRWSSDKKL
jgi:hypothetical protein